MKKFAFLILALLLAGAVAYYKATPEVQPYVDRAIQLFERVRGNIEANPVPVVIALGTFLTTFVYHKAKGKTFRESVEVAATRVTVVPTTVVAPVPEAEPENPVLKRAQARATRTQLLADRVTLTASIKKLPDSVLQAEKDFCFAEKATLEAKQLLGEKHKVRNAAQTKLAELRNELATGRAEIDAIEIELKKLAEVV